MEVGSGRDESLPEYTGTPGCTASVEDSSSPFSFFSLLVTESMLENIVQQTSLNAEQFISSHELGPYSRVRRWAKKNPQCM